MIQRAAALKIMERVNSNKGRIPFQISFVTADRDAWRKFKRLEALKESLSKDDPKRNDLQSQMDDIDLGGKIISHSDCILSGTRGQNVKKQAPLLKDPRHWVNRTRNIKFQPSGQIRKIHNALIISINGQPVLF